MYYNPPRRRRKRATRAAYSHPSRRDTGRIHGERILPYRSATAPRRRFHVRTHTRQVLFFLIALALLGWYSGLIPSALQTVSNWHLTSVPKTALVYPGQHSIQGSPTIIATKIESILCNAGSPACGSGQEIYNDGVAANINPAYTLAFFQHESSFGLAGVARYSHSLGNLRCIPNVPCPGGYASFPTWSEGFQTWYTLLNSKVYIGSGHTTIESIIPIYAPAADSNNEQAYINSVISAVAAWQK